jgi:hypothetical protein
MESQMPNRERLCSESLSIRKLPANYNPMDKNIFEHEMKRIIPETILDKLENVYINPDGIL